MIEPKHLDSAEESQILADFSSDLQSQHHRERSDEFNQPVRMLPRHGVFFRWPDQAIQDWIHPDDVQRAQQMLPGGRIFQLSECLDEADRAAGYSVIRYGEVALRVLPAMWLRVDDSGYRVGDRVEVLANNGTQTPLIGTIAEVNYNPQARRVEFLIETRSMVLKKKYTATDIRPCHKLSQPLSLRAQKLLSQSFLRASLS